MKKMNAITMDAASLQQLEQWMQPSPADKSLDEFRRGVRELLEGRVTLR